MFWTAAQRQQEWQVFFFLKEKNDKIVTETIYFFLRENFEVKKNIIFLIGDQPFSA